jgi:hypothetical protein
VVSYPTSSRTRRRSDLYWWSVVLQLRGTGPERGLTFDSISLTSESVSWFDSGSLTSDSGSRFLNREVLGLAHYIEQQRVTSFFCDLNTDLSHLLLPLQSFQRLHRLIKPKSLRDHRLNPMLLEKLHQLNDGVTTEPRTPFDCNLSVHIPTPLLVFPRELTNHSTEDDSYVRLHRQALHSPKKANTANETSHPRALDGA